MDGSALSFCPIVSAVFWKRQETVLTIKVKKTLMVKMKELWSLLTMIMVAMLSSSVVSCSGDDDGDGSNSSDSANSFDIIAVR